MGLCETSAFFLVLLACQATADDWMELPYGDDSFNVRAEFNTNVTLSCNVSSIPAEYEFQYWIAPDMTVMTENYTTSFRTLDGTAGWEVSSDGMELVAFLIQEAHFGFYYCVREQSSKEAIVLKLALNYKGPYWGDLWKKYETNTIVGLTASGSFLALVLIVAITWHFRYEDDSKEDKYRGDQGYENAVVNKAFEYQEIPGSTNPGFQPIQGVGFSPVSPIDVHRVTGDTMATTSKAATAF